MKARVVYAMYFAPCILLALGLATSLASVDAAGDSCDVSALPVAIRDLMKAESESWMIQPSSNLTPSGRRSWEYKKYPPSDCPGVAVGRFDNNQASYAVLLVHRDESDRGHRLLVFRPEPGGKYVETILESSDLPGAKDTFVRTAPIADFFDRRSVRQFKPIAREGILIVESGANQFGAEIFFSTQSGYRHEPVEY